MTAPLPQHILMNIQISRRLNDGNAAEWQLEGIASAKARGVYKGRRPSIDPAKVKKTRAGGMGPSAIAKALQIARASVYRVLGN